VTSGGGRTEAWGKKKKGKKYFGWDERLSPRGLLALLARGPNKRGWEGNSLWGRAVSLLLGEE